MLDPPERLLDRDPLRGVVLRPGADRRVARPVRGEGFLVDQDRRGGVTEREGVPVAQRPDGKCLARLLLQLASCSRVGPLTLQPSAR